MAEWCLICMAMDKPLVRDHNHVTGMIRGRLCAQCNSWVGVYEKNLLRAAIGKKVRGRWRYKAWLKMYEHKIKEHLQRDTGEVYSEKYWQGHSGLPSV